MKKLFVLILTILTTMMFAACGNDTEGSGSNSDSSKQMQKEAEQSAPVPTKSDTKILVAYFSRPGENYQVGYITKGNTHIVADMIAEATGADMFEIKTVNPYPEAYQECTDIAKQEQMDNARPEIAGKVEDMSKYDTIFLGYPIWWSDMPMAVYTFLESYDFSGKTIIPFCTSAGDYMTGKEVHIPEFAKGATMRDGIGIFGKECQDNPDKVREAVTNWLKNLGF